MKELCAGFILKNKNKILICRSTKCYMSDGSEIWGFPKGHLDEGEEALDGALRELEEEAGVTYQELKNFPIYKLPIISTKKKSLRLFVVEVDDTFLTKEFYCSSIVENRNYPEIDKYLWVNISEAPNYIKNFMKKVFIYLKEEEK